MYKNYELYGDFTETSWACAWTFLGHFDSIDKALDCYNTGKVDRVAGTDYKREYKYGAILQGSLFENDYKIVRKLGGNQ